MIAPYDDAWPCPACGLMITDPVQHRKASGCNQRDAESCPHCGLMKLRNVEHKCNVIETIEKNQYVALKAIAKAKGMAR